MAVNDANAERLIATAFITSTEFIQKIKPLYKNEYIISRELKDIISWCLDYFNEYGEAPESNIQQIYEVKAASMDAEETEAVEDILNSLSEEIDRKEKFNGGYVADRAVRYFNYRKLLSLQDEIEVMRDCKLDEDFTEEAALKLLGNNAIVMPREQGFYLNDKDELVSRLERAFDLVEQPLITFPPNMDQFLANEFVRGAFVAIQAPEKRGKSWYMFDIAAQAIRSNCNVVFFQAGDMNEEQFLLRAAVWKTKRHYRERFCSPMLVPQLDCLKNLNGTCELPDAPDNGIAPLVDIAEETQYYADNPPPKGKTLDLYGIPTEAIEEFCRKFPDYETCTKCREKARLKYHYNFGFWYTIRNRVKPLTAEDAANGLERWLRNKNRFRLETYANNELDVSRINERLDSLANEGFVPDIIIIDYADILAYDTSTRHGENEKWKQLRNLSQSRHCCVVTATQAKASSYGKASQDLGDYAEDKRKYAHVTAMLTLNQTPEEKGKGVIRMGKMLAREDDADLSKELAILQKIAMGRPYLGCHVVHTKS